MGRLAKAKKEFVRYIRSILSVFSKLITLKLVRELAFDALRYACWVIVPSETLRNNWRAMLEIIIDKVSLDNENWKSAVDESGDIVRRKLVLCFMKDFLGRENLTKARGGAPSFRHSI